jgi:hypothetical protein
MTGLQMKYFVLKPAGDDEYAAASRAGMRAYAKLIRDVNPELAANLIEWADTEHAKMYGRSLEDTTPPALT